MVGVVSPLRWSLVAARWSGYRLWVALALVVVSFSSNLVGSVVCAPRGRLSLPRYPRLGVAVLECVWVCWQGLAPILLPAF